MKINFERYDTINELELTHQSLAKLVRERNADKYAPFIVFPTKRDFVMSYLSDSLPDAVIRGDYINEHAPNPFEYLDIDAYSNELMCSLDTRYCIYDKQTGLICLTEMC